MASDEDLLSEYDTDLMTSVPQLPAPLRHRNNKSRAEQAVNVQDSATALQFHGQKHQPVSATTCQSHPSAPKLFPQMTDQDDLNSWLEYCEAPVQPQFRPTLKRAAEQGMKESVSKERVRWSSAEERCRDAEPVGRISSPWCPFYSSLANLILEEDHLPDMPDQTNHVALNIQVPGDSKLRYDSQEKGSETACTMFDFDLGPGICGFTTPALLPAFTALLQAFQSFESTDLLDSLQMATMSEILKDLRKHDDDVQRTDFQIRLPSIYFRFINARTTSQFPESEDGIDQLNVQVSGIHLLARSNVRKRSSDLSSVPRKGSCLHCAIDRGVLEVQDRPSKGEPANTAAVVSARDIVFWIIDQEEIVSIAQVRAFEGTTWANQLPFLAPLVSRTTRALKHPREQPIYANKSALLQRLVYRLTERAGDITDPPCLNRPAYILRIAGQHLRTQDSWKIMSRLRYMWQSLEHESDSIVQADRLSSIAPSTEIEIYVLAQFNAWRPWDLAHVEKTRIMRKIWHESLSQGSEKFNNSNMSLKLSFNYTGLLLDPGPQEHRSSFTNLTAALTIITDTGDKDVRGNGQRSCLRRFIVEVYCSQFSASLGWCLTELINEVASLFVGSESTPASSGSILSTSESLVRAFPLIQIVVGFKRSEIALRAINVSLGIRVANLSGSILRQTNSNTDSADSVIFRAPSLLAELEGHEKPILDWTLDCPMLYGSRSLSSRSSDVNARTSRVIGTCDATCLNVIDDLQSCCQMMGSVLKDEIGSFERQLKRFRAGAQQAEPIEGLPKQSNFNVCADLMLGHFALNIAVLPRVAYFIKGNRAQVSAIPISSAKLVVNAELDEHSQGFKNGGATTTEQLVKLPLPPINGRLRILKDVSPVQLEMDTTIDKVDVDAKFVRAFIDILNQPPIARAVLQSRQTISDLSDLAGPANSSKSRGEETITNLVTLSYRMSFTLIGLRIHASAPALESNAYQTELLFALGLTTVRACNKRHDQEVLPDKPRLEFAFRSVDLKLYERTSDHFLERGRLRSAAQALQRQERDTLGNSISMISITSDYFELDMHPALVRLALDIVAHLQEQIKSFRLADEAKQLGTLRRLPIAGLPKEPGKDHEGNAGREDVQTDLSSLLLHSVFSLDLKFIQVAWRCGETLTTSPLRDPEDLLLSVRHINLSNKREGSATLTIAELQVEMRPVFSPSGSRSPNSAIMPEIIFKMSYLSHRTDRRLTLQAAGKALDLRLASDFIVPASAIRLSIVTAMLDLSRAGASLTPEDIPNRKSASRLLWGKTLASVLVDADFAGAVVDIHEGRGITEPKSNSASAKTPEHLRNNGYIDSKQGRHSPGAVLRAPGVTMKMEYVKIDHEETALNAEVKITASSNVLYPSVVPLIIQASSSMKEVMGRPGDDAKGSLDSGSIHLEKPLTAAATEIEDPVTRMSRCKVNLGLYIKQQQFSLSCQPVARVAASAQFDRMFLTLNTVSPPNQERFFALSMTARNFRASVRHVYSRESTASLEVESVILSMMNDKHVSDTQGLFAILNFSPTRTSVRARQLADFLLFREIWYPAGLKETLDQSSAVAQTESQAVVVQKYQQATAGSAFSWKAVVSLEELQLQADLGQGLGRSTFTISRVWASSSKTSDWEQNLCLGFDKILVEGIGKVSGFIELRNFRLRSSIQWSDADKTVTETPLIQATVGLEAFRSKAVFDYQPFAVTDISKFHFFMYNASSGEAKGKDRLVAHLEGERVQIFCCSTAASSAYGLYQAIARLVRENESGYETSLKELHLKPRRQSSHDISSGTSYQSDRGELKAQSMPRAFRLHTDVVVSLQALNIGVFPSTFFDNQIFKIEVKDAQFRFAVSASTFKTQSRLALTLGQLRVALSTVNRVHTEALGEASVEEIVRRAISSRGGTILKVPKVVAAMHTWQADATDPIDYTFRSTFEGKVDVGWNYSRISFIRGMWATHSKALAARIGKPLPQSAVQISGGTRSSDESGEHAESEKITAVVNMPQSRFEYRALEPPIMETPQLREMGEATPPLEWIGLQRDKLPHVTHQVIIVTLLEVAKNVEDAYTKILGSTS